MRRVTVFLFVVLLGAACSGGEAITTTSTEPATTKATAEGTTAATTTELPPEPGEIVSTREIAAPDGARAWVIEYWSQGIDGAPVTVTGWIAAPEGPGPPEGRPVVAWGHPTVGLGDECAPSISGSPTPFIFGKELDAGWVVAVTDYEGLGTPGLHPYLVGESEARSVLDIVRAASKLEEAHAGKRVALWGFSQGGHAVLWASELASQLAPELDVVGVVAVSPPFFLAEAATFGLGTFDQGYTVATVTAYAETYGLDLTSILTAEALEELEEITTSCGDPRFWRVAARPGDAVFLADPGSTEPWASLLRANQPGSAPSDAPILLVYGGNDAAPVWVFEAAVAELCGAGAQVSSTLYPEATHLAVSGAARQEIHNFILDRIAGNHFEDECMGA